MDEPIDMYVREETYSFPHYHYQKIKEKELEPTLK
jgi:hypothetical protein